MEQYNVTGMSCAACSSRVEKAVSKVPGVTSCSVSLLTNSMGVEGTASSHDIITAVEQAGYGASLKGANKEQVSLSEAEEAIRDVLLNFYGKASRSRRDNVLLHEIYEAIYSTGFFEKETMHVVPQGFQVPI